MEFESFTTTARWQILERLAEREKSASEIAEETGASLANISQQLKLLEAHGLVKRVNTEHVEGEKRGAGKPRQAFALAKEVAFLALVKRGLAAKRTLKLDPHQKVILAIWALEKDHAYLERLYWQQEGLVAESVAIAVVDSTPEEIHLLVVAPEERLDKLRKAYSKIIIKPADGNEKRVISWTHSFEELREGLSRGEEYFKKLLTKPAIIVDREDLLRTFLDEVKGKR